MSNNKSGKPLGNSFILGVVTVIISLLVFKNIAGDVSIFMMMISLFLGFLVPIIVSKK